MLVDMTGGMAGCGSKLMIVQDINSTNEESRGVFIKDRLVAVMMMLISFNTWLEVPAKSKHNYN